MTVGALCTRPVHTISPRATVRDAAVRMKTHNVGSLVVVDGSSPIEGIVTDRDLVVRALAERANPGRTAVRDVMTIAPAAVQSETSVDHALEIMADHRVRRLVVLDASGGLRGLLSYDDVVSFLVDEMDDAGRLLHRVASA